MSRLTAGRKPEAASTSTSLICVCSCRTTAPIRVTIRSISAQVISRMSPINTTYVSPPRLGRTTLSPWDSTSMKGISCPRNRRRKEGADEPTREPAVLFDQGFTLDPANRPMSRSRPNRTLSLPLQISGRCRRTGSTTTLDIGDVNGRPLSITARAPQYQNSYENGQLGCARPGLFHTEVSGHSLNATGLHNVRMNTVAVQH